MATVRRPSSVAARKQRMAISDRLATSSFFIGYERERRALRAEGSERRRPAEELVEHGRSHPVLRFGGLEDSAVLVDCLRDEGNRHRLWYWHHLQRGHRLLHHLRRPQSPRDAAVTHQADRLVVPLSDQVVERVQQRRRGAVVVLGHDEDKSIEPGNPRAPGLLVGTLVLTQPRMIALGKERQVDVLEIDYVDVEAAVGAGALGEPVGDRPSYATFAYAGDDHA